MAEQDQSSADAGEQRLCAWVTGGSRGIGAACAQALAQTGHHVVLTYRAGREQAEALAQTLPHATAVQLDLSLAQPKLADQVAALIKAHGAPDALVHNAGVAQDSLFALMGPDAWHNVLTTNLLSFYSLVRPIARQMLRRRRGRIVTVASLSGQRGNAGQTNYAASKAGLIAATKSLALELAPRGITANAVAPGLIKTDMTASLDQAQLADAIPMKRFGEPHEVAQVVSFLCSDAAAYVTGQVIGVNGGLHT